MPDITQQQIDEALEEAYNQVSTQQTGHQYEVRVRPRDEDGQPLYGCIVYYVSPTGNETRHEYSSGDYVSFTTNGGPDGPTGALVIGLYGRSEGITTFNGDGSAVEQVGSAYEITVESAGSYPDIFEKAMSLRSRCL